MSTLPFSTLSSLSTKKLSYLSACMYQATQIPKGPVSRHGCILVRNGKIIGQGHNSHRSRVKGVPNICSVHAEHACLLSYFGPHTAAQSRFLRGTEKWYREKELQGLQKSQKQDRLIYHTNLSRREQLVKFQTLSTMSSALASV